MKKAIKTILIILGIMTVVFLIIHRRVIAAWINGTEMPKMPDWHPKCPFMKKKEAEEIEVFDDMIIDDEMEDGEFSLF